MTGGPHSFFMAHGPLALVEHETPEGAAEPAAAPAPDVASAPAAAAEGAAPAAPAVAAEPPLTMEALTQALQANVGPQVESALERLLAEPAPQGPPQPGALPEWDPYDPQVVAAHQQAAIQQALGPISEQLAQFGPLIEHLGQSESQRMAMERFGELETQVGGPFGHDQALINARWQIAQGADPDHALAEAARAQRAYDESIRSEAYARGVADTQAAAGAMNGHAPAPVGAAGAAPLPERGPGGPGTSGDYGRATRRAYGQQNPEPPQ